MSEEVVVFKLSTGEELMGRLGKQDDDTATINKPVSIAMVPGPQQGQMGISLVPFLVSNTDADSVAIMRAHIVATARPNKDLESRYIEATTGLSLATSMP